MDLEDPGRRIETYIGPKSFTKILALVMACAAAILVLMGILSSSGSEKIITEVFDPLDSETGKDAYLDVVGISDWLVELDSNTWYAAEDAYGYLFIVSVNGSQYKKMAAQQAYWNREDDSAPMPEPYRVNGLVRSFGSGVEKDLAEVTGLSVTEFENFFGDRWLDGKTSESSESGAVWYLGALFAGLFALVLAMSVFPAAVTAKKCLRALEAAGLLERAAMELEAPGAYVLGKDGCRITQNFVFTRRTGFAAPCKDILWAFQRDQRVYFMPVNSFLVMQTGSVAASASLGKRDKDGQIAQALMQLLQRNPDLMVGFNSENSKRFKELKKAQKESKTFR